MDIKSIADIIGGYEKEMIATMGKMVAIKSISPLSGGEGESKRAAFLQGELNKYGVHSERFDYKDESNAIRSNIIAKIGDADRTIWIVSHIDTVSEGERSLWETDPFVTAVKEGRIYGRGTCDNGQEVIASLFAARALKESKIGLRYNLGIAFVADEEIGSRYGIQMLLKEKIFSKDDLYIVPDYGNEEGDVIEIAEKGMLWAKITVVGKQAHASTPANGVNAFRYLSRLMLAIDEALHKKYSASSEIFDPKTSTFEMTKHEKNVDSINIIPGSETAYIDCRVLPQYSLDDVLSEMEQVAARKEFSEVGIKIEAFLREDAAPESSRDDEVVKLLTSTLHRLRGTSPKAIGIGGGTCAAFFRKKGFPVAVWSTVDEVAHQPNEFCRIKNLVDDAKVLANLVI